MADMRVVSLLPSATELLVAVGGAELLVGRSHECDWPPAVRSRPALTAQRTVATTSADIDRQVAAARAAPVGGGGGEVAGLYTLDADLLRRLRPDLILTQDLCDVCSIDPGTVRSVAATLDPVPEVLWLNPRSIEDVFDDVLRVGDAIGRPREASGALADLRERYWSAVDHVNPYADGPEIAFLEWMDPLFSAGHWTPQLIRAAGGRHSLSEPGMPSRRLEPEALVEARPERLIICPCGYDLGAIRLELADLTGRPWWRELPASCRARVALVDGSRMFNRPGPGLVDGFRWLVGWINDRPELIPEGFPWEERALKAER